MYCIVLDIWWSLLFELLKKVIYILYVILGVVGAGVFGLLWCPFFGLGLGMFVLPQIVWKMMSGEMHKGMLKVKVCIYNQHFPTGSADIASFIPRYMN